jgi:hypothetical protein
MIFTTLDNINITLEIDGYFWEESSLVICSHGANILTRSFIKFHCSKHTNVFVHCFQADIFNKINTYINAFQSLYF